MIKNYFTIAVRNLLKQKGLSFINIFGLSVGLAAFILFMIYALNEFSFDGFHKKGKLIYRAYLDIEAREGEKKFYSTYHPMPLGPALKKDLAGVREFVRLKGAWTESFLKMGDKVSREKLSFADPAFFTVFSFPLKEGNPYTVLKEPNSIVITEKVATKLFGKEEAVGKVIQIKYGEGYEPFSVTGVAEDIPSNSGISFSMIGNFEYLLGTNEGKRSANNWHRSSYQTFVELEPGSHLNSDYKKLDAFYMTYYGEDEKERQKEKGGTAKQSATYRLQPLAETHTDPAKGGMGDKEAIDPQTIWILLGIATGVLIIACINFTTLSIGRSAGRSKEIGVRKVIGGTKGRLVVQFLIEAFVMSLVSAGLGILLAYLLLPFFNQMADRELQFSFRQFPQMFWLIGVLIALVSLLAGSYPAWVLSSFKPVEVLKTKVRLKGSNYFTKSLVTMQFVLSAGLIICTLVVLSQLKYMRSQNPGFNKENIVVIDGEGTDPKEPYPILKRELAQYPEILGTASAELSMGEGMGWSRSGFKYKGKDKDVYEYFIDTNYLELMGIKLLAGRNFDSHFADDTVKSVIINEAMMKDFGWTLDNAVGQQLTGYMESLSPVVIGVVKDINFRSFAEKIEPQMFHQFKSYKPWKYFVRMSAGDPSKSLATIEKVWRKIMPEYPLKYSFLDEDLRRFYEGEERWGKIVGWAGGISIFLACLGLLGLAALAAVNRTKEVGIRKVLGASVTGIVGLLSKDFLKLVVIALLIASPLAWYFMHRWLEGFAYRINIGWSVFLITAIGAMLVALVTVGVQAVKAAVANPVTSLRTE